MLVVLWPLSCSPHADFMHVHVMYTLCMGSSSMIDVIGAQTMRS